MSDTNGLTDAEVIRLIEESGALLAAYEPRVWLVNLKDVRALLAAQPVAALASELAAIGATADPQAWDSVQPAVQQPAEDAGLLDRHGKIRGDLKASAYCVGNEYKPFHPSASHVRPEWRDGWNACFVAAIRAARAKE